MKIILRKIIDSQSPFHNTIVDILIVDGIKKSRILNEEQIKKIVANLHVSEGWFDSSVSLGEPGFERL
jgi:dihydroorotase